MVSLRLVCGVSTLLALAHQILAISEEDIPEDVNENLFMSYVGRAAIHEAAWGGWVEVTKALIEAGADVNKVNRVYGLFETPLFIAAMLGRPRICEVLINAGADINMKNNEGYGKTALEIAIENRQKGVYDVLKKHGASVPQISLPEILEFHGLASASEINGPSKTERLPPNISPLEFAAGWGNRKAIALLLDAGADVNYPNGMPLFMAVGGGHANATKMLLEAGADVNRKNFDGITPLIRAVEDIWVSWTQGPRYRSLRIRDALKIIKMLIEAGAELDATNDKGETAFYCAAKEYHHNAARMLVEAGADTSIMPSKFESWQKEHVLTYLEQLNQEINNQG